MDKETSQIEEILLEADGLLLSDPSKALDLLQELRTELEENQQPVTDEIKFKIAQTENQIGEFEKSEIILKELLENYQKRDYKKGMAKVSNELGNNYWARGDLNNSLIYYLQSLKILESRQEFHNMCIPLNNIGQIYWYKQDFEKARAAYLKSQELARRYCPDLEADALTNLGILFAEESAYDKAEQYYLQAKELYEEYNNQSSLALLYVNLALLYEDNGEIEKAEEYHQKAIAGFRKLKNTFGEMHALMNYSGFLLKNEQNSKVLRVLDEAYKLAEQHEAKNQLSQIYLHYRDYYKAFRDYEKAYQYLEKYYQIEIERLDNENNEKMNEILTRYETEKKEREAEFLREQNEILSEKNLQIEKQSHQIDLANQKLQKANLELENRIDKLLQNWHEQEMINRGEEKLEGIYSVISSIAHQWKQPLNIIGILIQNFIDAYEYDEKGTYNVEEFQDQIFQQLRYMSNTIDDFAYGLQGSQHGATFSLDHAVKLSTDLITGSFKTENVQLSINLEKDIRIVGSESKFIQVLMVIFSNAMEVFYSAQQQEPQIMINAWRTGKEVKLEIYNSGPPIPENIINSIFDVFFSTKSKDSNTGLGLTLARKIIVENMQGRIYAENRANGVSFILVIPLMQMEGEKTKLSLTSKPR